MERKIYLVAVGPANPFDVSVQRVFQHLKEQKVRLLVESGKGMDIAADFLQRSFSREHVVRCEFEQIPICMRSLVQNTSDNLVVMAAEEDIRRLIIRLHTADSDVTVTEEVLSTKQPFLYDPILKKITPLAA